MRTEFLASGRCVRTFGFLLLVGLPMLTHAIDRVEMVEDEGVIHRVDYGQNQMIIDGVRFAVSAGAPIRIRGDIGSFAALVRGMKIRFVYENRGPSERNIVRLDQLPDNTRLDRN